VSAVFDLVLSNTSVLTPLPAPGVTAVAVSRGRIARLGAAADLVRDAGPNARHIDLGGRTLVPGFNDAHAHIWKIGQLRTTMLDLRRVRSIAQLVAEVREFSRRTPADGWVLGRGYNEAVLEENRAPTRHDLDAAAPGRPVALTRTCGHIYAVNSVALDRAHIGRDTHAPVGGVIERDERGEPTGLLHETAMGLIGQVLPRPGRTDYEAMIDAGLRHQLSRGITSTSDCGVPPPLLEVYREMDAAKKLAARVNVMPLRRVDGVREPVPLPAQSVGEMLRVDTVKFLADGGLSGATAALSRSYRHANTTGVLRFDRDELLALCRESQDAGWRIATHAIGDVAIDQVLDVYEALGPHPRGLSHRIEHFGLPDEKQLHRAARLQIVAAPQTVFIHSLGRNFRSYLPDEFLPRCYPVRAMMDAGIRVALSSDAPVVEDDNPLLGIAAALTRRDSEGRQIAPEQAIAIHQALDAYTIGGARATGDERHRGSIEPGKWADLAVLSANPLTVEPEALTDISVDMTLLAGKVVFER
jgi:predicted amidohydrolase YtcJ